MIIECTNCHKKFKVDPSQIPESGRNIQCGTCDFIWFYKHEEKKTSNLSPINENLEKKDHQNFEKIENSKIVEKKISKKTTIKKSRSSNLGNFLSYLIVAIISFIALIIILDTFKTQLINVFPGIELILFNLFESLKDIFLFFKNLIE